MSKYSFYKDVQRLQHHFSDNIDTFTARNIATNLWTAYERLFYRDGEYVRYKKRGSYNSLEGSSNKQGIRFKDDVILWNGLKIPVVVDYNNYYENQALKSEISYCRITRKFVRGKYKYYVQIVLKGTPPIKVDNETGENVIFCKPVNQTNYVEVFNEVDELLADVLKNLPSDIEYFRMLHRDV